MDSHAAGATPRFHGLQILRVLAAVMVCVFHASGYIQRYRPSVRLWSQGAAGVDVFFVISGFVIFYSSQKLIGMREGRMHFLRRRLIRVVPMYWLATAILTLAAIVAPRQIAEGHVSLLWVLTSFLFLPAHDPYGYVGPLLAVGWTLNLEVFFYFVFLLCLGQRVLVWCSTALLLLALASLLPLHSNAAILFYLHPLLLEFVAGMWIAQLCLHRIFVATRLAALAAGVSVVFLCIDSLQSGWPRVLHFGLPAIVLVYACASLESSLRRTPRFVLFLADASYMLYLFHVIVEPLFIRLLVRAHLLQPLVAFPVLVVGAVACAAVLRLWIDLPVYRWLRRRWDEPAV